MLPEGHGQRGLTGMGGEGGGVHGPSIAPGPVWGEGRCRSRRVGFGVQPTFASAPNCQASPCRVSQPAVGGAKCVPNTITFESP